MRVFEQLFLAFLLLASWGCGGSRSEPVTVESEGVVDAGKVGRSRKREVKAQYLECTDGSNLHLQPQSDSGSQENPSFGESMNHHFGSEDLGCQAH